MKMRIVLGLTSSISGVVVGAFFALVSGACSSSSPGTDSADPSPVVPPARQSGAPGPAGASSSLGNGGATGDLGSASVPPIPSVVAVAPPPPLPSMPAVSAPAPADEPPDFFVEEDEPILVAIDVPAERSCGVQDFDRRRKPSEMLLVLDRSSSMKGGFRSTDGAGVREAQSKWDVTVKTVVEAIESTGADVWWGLKTYPELSNVEMCIEGTIVPLIHSPIAEDNSGDVISQVLATEAEGDGTPTGDAIRFGFAHLMEREALSDNPKYMLLVTDGKPSCTGGGLGSPTDYAVAHIAEAYAAGYPTYVIGVDTSAGQVVQRLNEMAVAGGKARPNPSPPAAQPLDPATGEPLADPPPEDHVSFYLSSSSEDIAEALKEISGQIASCVFDLEPPPPVPDNIAVDFSGQRTERDPQRINGWEYTKEDYSQLEVYGSWCDRIKTEAMNVVNVKYGCPDIPIPPIQ